MISLYLNITGSDDKELELKELRRAINKLTTAISSSTQTHEKQKLLIVFLVAKMLIRSSHFIEI